MLFSSRAAAVTALLAALLFFGTSIAAAANYAATASLSPTSVVMGVPTTFTLTVNNTGSSVNIGAVEVRRPSNRWLVTSCLTAPAGWTIQTEADTMCRYRSAASTSDDILPGQSSSAFTFVAEALPGAADVAGAWKVTVSNMNTFAKPARLMAASGSGLTVNASSFEVLDAVVAGSAATVGDACPAAVHSAYIGSSVTLVICGRNATTGTLTTAAGTFTTLGGTFVASHGSFSGGAVAPGATSVVLGNWASVVVPAAEASGYSV